MAAKPAVTAQIAQRAAERSPTTNQTPAQVAKTIPWEEIAIAGAVGVSLVLVLAIVLKK